MPRSSNFNDKAKAKIFARDHATCSFSGKSLWILDHGATYFWEMDWADHDRPVSRGGRSNIENGVCASYSMNVKKGANTRDNLYFFRCGHPTEAYFSLIGCVPSEVAYRLRRSVKDSDWYFNRALAQVMIAVEDIALGNEGGYKRKAPMWARSAIRRLRTWRKMTGKKGYADMQSRGLLPLKPTEDQRVLMALHAVDAKKEVLRGIRRLVPYYSASVAIVEGLGRMRSTGGARRLLQSAKRNPKVSPTIRRMVQRNVEILFPAMHRRA